jgi:ATP-binding cassette subfamily F protein 3
MSIVRLAGVHREIGTFVILDHVEGSIALGDRVGLVGPNGAGKTTLMRIVAGLDEPDGGEVQRKRALTLGLLGQESHFDAAFMAAPDIRAAVRHGAGDLEAMEGQLASLEVAHRVTEPVYAELQHRFEVLGGYTLDQRVDESLSGLGFSPADVVRPPSSLSGGEQTRAALARLVIANPDLLLLDEPTNHLDIDALEWLEEHLRRRQGSLLVASHDRAFLDATVSRIWELRDRRLTAFRGDYSSYHRQREERDERAVKDAGTQAGQIAHERDLIQKYRSQRKHTKMHEHEARLERLQADRVDVPKASRALRLPSKALAAAGPSRSGTVAVRIEDLVAGYTTGGSRVDVVRVPWLVAERGERIGIVGPNGAGKTTLLRTIAGELPLLDGTLSFGQGVSLGYLAQLRGAAIPGTTVLDALLEAMPVVPGEARSYLARFLFRGDDVLKEVRALSGGERSRLELALLGIMPSNLLLLDEPTNHLDIPAREAIESFLRETPATVLVVSHDRRLLETICDRLWVVADGLAAPFYGGYRAWRAAIADGWTVTAAAENEAKRLRVGSTTRVAASVPATAALGSNGNRRVPDPTPVATTRSGSVSVAVAGAVAAPAAVRTKQPKLSKDLYRRQKASVEAELTRLGLRKNHLEMAIGNPTLAANFVELRRITSELADVDSALRGAEEQWLELEERAP